MIEYIVGDATKPASTSPKIIAHVCNSAGGWGRGFTGALSKRWLEPERSYRAWHRVKKATGLEVRVTGDFSLGQSQLVSVSGGMYIGDVCNSGPEYVLNMIAQEGFGPSATPRIRYDALALCLRHAASFAIEFGASIHMPRIGCGLGMGDWTRVAALVERLIGAPVFVYDLPGRAACLRPEDRDLDRGR